MLFALLSVGGWNCYVGVCVCVFVCVIAFISVLLCCNVVCVVEPL